MMKLVQKVWVIIPSVEQDGKEFDNTPIVDYVAEELARAYGGVQVTDVRGGYVHKDGRLVYEDCKKVMAYVINNQFRDAQVKIKDIAEDLKLVLNQESVMFGENETAFLV